MLDSIKELEKELEVFHKNIKNSNELIDLMKSTNSLLENQIKSFEDQTNQLQDKIQTVPNDIQKLVLKEYQGFNESAATLIEEYTRSINKSNEDLHNKMVSLVNKISGDFLDNAKTNAENITNLNNILIDNGKNYEEILLSITTKFESEIKKDLIEVENNIATATKELDEKYTEFRKMIDASNVDKLYDFCKEIDEKANKKNTTILIAVCISIIVSILGIFL